MRTVRDDFNLRRVRAHIREQEIVWKSANLNLAKFYAWQRKSVSHAKMSRIPSSKLAAAGIRSTNFKLNSCYDNAIAVSMSGLALGVLYVEGYIIERNELFAHAWNKWNGEHFDITAGLRKKDGLLRGRTYISISELNPIYCVKYSMQKTRHLQVSHFLDIKDLPPTALPTGFNLVDNYAILSRSS